jgi:mitochondrial import inner membrane translocase subunit TIM8
MDDSDGAVNVTSEELSRLTPGDNRELQQFIQNENQKSQVQRCKHLPQSYPPRHFRLLSSGTVKEIILLTSSFTLAAVHELTETCFKKCITGSISSGKLASKEESCIQNCVERFMDSNLAVLRHLEHLRAGQ